METLERIIEEHPFFAGLNDEFMELVLGCASNVRFPKDAYIFREGQAANTFYLVREGNVSLEIHAPQRKPIVVATVGVGEVLGWSWLLPPYEWKFSAHATADTRAIALNGKCLREKCEKNHDLGYEFLKRFAQIVVNRLEATRFQLLDVYSAQK
jgi:CRP/FNR family transcriptional regulator, cyclic AMP receptor protein